MAFTARKNILDDLEYRLGMVKIANGYTSNINLVDRQRDTDAEPFSITELPAFNVRDQKAEIVHNISDDEHTLPVTIEMHTSSRITAAEAENLLADVARCVNLNSNWNGYADGTTIESHEIDITQTGDVITAGTVDILIHYTTDKGAI
jgi:hypothetical protein